MCSRFVPIKVALDTENAPLAPKARCEAFQSSYPILCAPFRLSVAPRARPNSDNQLALFIRDQESGRRAFNAEA